MMVVILTPVDGIIRWLPRGFSCSPRINDHGIATIAAGGSVSPSTAAKQVCDGFTVILFRLLLRFIDKEIFQEMTFIEQFLKGKRAFTITRPLFCFAVLIRKAVFSFSGTAF